MKRFTFAMTLLVAITPSRADDLDRARLDNWPNWRGPLVNGTAPNADPPVTWDEHKNVKWKVPLSSRGSSTPIVWGDQVFVLTATNTGRAAKPDERPKPDPRFEIRTQPSANFHRFEVISFDRRTGKERWRRTAAEMVPHEGHQNTHSYCGGSPTTDGRFLYVSFGSFGNYCYDLDGNLKWKKDLGRLNTRLAWGEAVSPVIHGDVLLLNWDQEADSALYCLDARTGDVRWRTPRDEGSTWTTPLVVTYQGRAQAIVNGTNRIRAHDLKTGQVIWECGGMTKNAIPSPVLAGDVVYVMSGYTGSAVRAIRLGGTGDLTTSSHVLWKHDRGTPYVPSPLLAGNRLFFTNGNTAFLTALDVASGKPLIDDVRLPNASAFYSSPIAAADRVYLVDRNGTTLVLKQSDKLEILTINRLNDAVDASPVAVGKQLILRGMKNLWCLEGD